jgi:hypothetical protein
MRAIAARRRPPLRRSRRPAAFEAWREAQGHGEGWRTYCLLSCGKRTMIYSVGVLALRFHSAYETNAGTATAL